MRTAKPDIFRYLDYRRFLLDYYVENKKLNPSFSFRYFAQIAGLRSFNYLKLVLEGKRRVTSTFFDSFCRALKLDANERTYFSSLIAFTDEKNHHRKSEQFEALLKMRPKTGVDILSDANLIMCKDWFYIPILELTETNDFNSDPKWVATRLGIRPQEARRAMEDLKEVGLLIEKAGKLSRKHVLADTTDEVSTFSIKNYHEKNLVHASSLVTQLDISEREYGSITFAADEEKFSRIKERIKQFRKEIFEMLDSPSGKSAEVYQFNVQLYRLTHPQKENKK